MYVFKEPVFTGCAMKSESVYVIIYYVYINTLI